MSRRPDAAPNPEQSTSTSPSSVLAARAASFRQQILDVAMGPGGMIIAFVKFDDRKPFQEGEDYSSALDQFSRDAWNPYLPRPTVAEDYYGENTLWATGWFLHSQMLRYKATGEQEALDTARKCFRDLNHIFRLDNALEPGVLAKPHGGRGGVTTSYDQAACPVLFYVDFAREHGTPAEQAEATENMRRHGEYYLRRNWVMNHFNNLVRVVDRPTTSLMKYLACLHAAYVMTGETAFRDEAFKQLREIIRIGRLPWAMNPYETNHNLYYWALLCDYWSRTELADAFDWMGAIRQYWQAAQMAIGNDGLFVFGHYDHVAHTFAPYPDGWRSRDEARQFPMQTPKRNPTWWISSTSMGNRSLCTACVAALALLVRSLGIDPNADEIAKRILLRLDDDTLRWWWGDEKTPEEFKQLVNIFAPEVAGAWLIAYWMGRLQKVW